MRKALLLGDCALLAVSVVSCCCLGSKSGTISLFDGKTLEGWQYALADNAISRDQVWSVQDGILKCKGEPIGVLYKGPDVVDFDLEVEYRWTPGKKPGNSGIFSRIERPVTPLPRAIECQLQHGSAGDLLGLKGKTIRGNQPRPISVKGHPVAGDISGNKKIEDAENPAGEWNRVRIEGRGPVYTVYVNGRLVNRVEGVDTTPGPVGIQSEGGQIEFRRVDLTPLKIGH